MGVASPRNERPRPSRACHPTFKARIGSMFPSWRLQLREARLAWRGGRVDEAGALLAASPLCDFLPAKKLARDVAAKMLERAGDRFARGDSSAGWHDLTTADRLGAAN